MPRKPYKSKVSKDYFYVDEDGEVDFKMINFLEDSDDEGDDVGLVSIKEQNPKKEVREEKALVSQIEKKKSDWIIDSGCSHYMIGDVNFFLKFNSYDVGVVRVGINATCHIKGKYLLHLMERLTLKMFTLWMVRNIIF